MAASLADCLGVEMLDADDFHPASNVAKMESGTPLDDTDRAGWLEALNRELRERIESGNTVVLACSALKQRYRDALSRGGVPLSWIYLKGDRATILDRMSKRKDHFMPPALVDSQLEALEEPTDALVLDIRLPVEELVSTVLETL